MENGFIIGKLTEGESEVIQKIYQRKMALLELLPTLKLSLEQKSVDYLYEKIVNDLLDTNQKMQKWWEDVASEHKWSYGEKDQWSVNFNTKEVMIHSQI